MKLSVANSIPSTLNPIPYILLKTSQKPLKIDKNLMIFAQNRSKVSENFTKFEEI